MDLKEIKSYDNSWWLKHLEKTTVYDTKLIKEMFDWLIEQAENVERLEETVRIYKASDELIKEQSKKVRYLFPLENTVGYGQLCDKVLELSDEKSFFVKAYTEKIMKEE